VSSDVDVKPQSPEKPIGYELSPTPRFNFTVDDQIRRDLPLIEDEEKSERTIRRKAL
jgi:hypothetical protein